MHMSFIQHRICVHKFAYICREWNINKNPIKRPPVNMSIVRGEICAQNNYPTCLNQGSLVFQKLVVNPGGT